MVASCVVAGTGDGGLIEALRLLYRNFQAGKVNHGTAELLESEGLRRRLEAVEARVRLRVSDEILRSGFPLASAFRDEIAQDLWTAYDAEFDDLGDSFRRALIKQRSRVARVTLIGERAWPTEHTAAPYHRLLLVHALREGWIEYHQVRRGELVVRDSVAPPEAYPRARVLDIPVKTVTFKSARRIAAASGNPAVVTDEDVNHELDGAFFVSRFPTTSPLAAILDPISPDLLDNVRKRQSLYADQDWISAEQANLLARRLELPTREQPEAWLEQAIQDARPFFHERYGMRVREDHAGEQARFVLHLDHGKGWADQMESGPLPTCFYGVPVDTDDLFPIPTAPRGGH